MAGTQSCPSGRRRRKALMGDSGGAGPTAVHWRIQLRIGMDVLTPWHPDVPAHAKRTGGSDIFALPVTFSRSGAIMTRVSLRSFASVTLLLSLTASAASVARAKVSTAVTARRALAQPTLSPDGAEIAFV